MNFQHMRIAQPDDESIELRPGRAGDVLFDDYQRGDRKTARYVEVNYDSHLFQPWEVSERADGKLYGIDCRQRATGIVNRSGPDTDVLMRVHYGLDVAAEVRLFELMNTQRVRVSAFDILKAQRHAREPEAVGIFDVVEGLELTLRANNGVWCVGSVATLQRIYRKPEGAQLLGYTLGVLKAAWGNDPRAFHALPLIAVSRVLQEARDNQPKDVWKKPEDLATVINRNYRPFEQIQGQETKSGAKAFAKKIAEAWNNRKKGSRRFTDEFIASLNQPDPPAESAAA